MFHFEKNARCLHLISSWRSQVMFRVALGLPWWSGGWDSILLLQFSIPDWGTKILLAGARKPEMLQGCDSAGSSGSWEHCLENTNVKWILSMKEFDDTEHWISLFGLQVITLSVARFSSFQFSRVHLFATPWTAAHQASLSISNFRSLLVNRAHLQVLYANNLMVKSRQ